MESLNQTLFLQLNAGPHPAIWMLLLSTFFAEVAIGLIPLVLLIGWLRGTDSTRKVMLEAAASGVLAILLNQLVDLVWQHPRPFMIGLGHTYLAHAADSSFPSDHLSLWWSVSFTLLLHRRTRIAGLGLGIIGVPIAWSRIYLGVHFPLDMVGSAIFAIFSASLCLFGRTWLIDPVFPSAAALHRKLLAPLIRRGWVLE
jgi:undecaprenyl-diphosphatase